MDAVLVDNARVMAKGQITLPKDIRKALGIGTGDKVTLIYQDGQVIMLNSAIYAMKYLQENMAGKWEPAGVTSDDDVMDAVATVRGEIEGRTSRSC